MSRKSTYQSKRQRIRAAFLYSGFQQVAIMQPVADAQYPLLSATALEAFCLMTFWWFVTVVVSQKEKSPE